MKEYSPLGRRTRTVFMLSLLLVAGSGAAVLGDSSYGVSVLRCDWQIEPIVTRGYDVAKAVERIAAVDPKEQGRADQSLYRVAVLIVKGSTGRFQELANDPKWEQEHLKLDGFRLTVVAPPQVQAELAGNIRAWELAGLSQISVEVGLIFREDARESKMFLDTDNRMVVISDQQALDLTKEPLGKLSRMYSPRVTTFSGQQATFVCPVNLSALGLANKAPDAKDSGETASRGQLKVTWRAIENHDLTKIRLEGTVRVGAADSGNHSKLDAHPGGDGQTRERWRQFGFNAELADSQATLPVRIPTGDAKRSFFVLLSARRVVPPLPLEPEVDPRPAKLPENRLR